MLRQEGGLRLPFRLSGLIGSQKFVGVHHLPLGQASVPGVHHINLFCAPLRLAQADIGEVVSAQNHILGGDGNRLAVLRPEQVVRREHQEAGLGLGLHRQGVRARPSGRRQSRR